jgi:hypothetical protein
MASRLAICQLPNGQCAKCMPYASNPCPHSHMKRLNVESWIKLKQKHITKVKLKCAIQNKQIYGLTTNHSPTPLLEQEQMWNLDVEKMEWSSKIALKDVSWWMSIKDAYNLGALVIAKPSKEGCISLAVGGTLSHTTWKHNWRRFPFNLRDIFLQNGFIKYMKPRA